MLERLHEEGRYLTALWESLSKSRTAREERETAEDPPYTYHHSDRKG